MERIILSIKNTIKLLVKPKYIGMIDYYRRLNLNERFGGAFNGQRFRKKIFLSIIENIDFAAIIETGTCFGTTTEFMHRSSKLRVYSVEIDERLYGYAFSRFALNGNVSITHGDSRDMLNNLIRQEDLRGKSLFVYLDAHWKADLPLNDEIAIIFTNWPDSVIMIDDFQVNGDDGYGYDDYGNGKVLNINYLKHTCYQDLSCYFPRINSRSETGARRGCVIIARGFKVTSKLDVLECIEKYDIDA